MKCGLAAAQLRQANPAQLQLYTVQIDYARSVYESGAWFNRHPECTLKDAHGNPVLNNATNPATARGHCDAKVNVTGKNYPYGACYTYGFDTECGAQQWVKFITDACEKYNLDGVFIDGECPLATSSGWTHYTISGYSAPSQNKFQSISASHVSLIDKSMNEMINSPTMIT